MLRRVEVHRRFGETYYFQLQRQRVSQSKNSRETGRLPLASTDFFPLLLFDPENRYDILLRNFGISPNYTA
jgi:hypothetical protein